MLINHWPRRAAAVIVSTLLAAAGLSAAAQSASGEGMQEIQLAADKFQKGAAPQAWVEASPAIPATEDKGPGVLLLADTQFYAGTPSAYYVHRAMQANSPGAVAELGRYSIEFVPAYQKLTLHTLRIIRGGATIDKLATARVTFLQREAGLEQGMYSGVVTASILVDDVRVGDVFDVAYTTEGENPVYGNRYYQIASWDQPARTELRRVTLYTPKSRNIEWKLQGLVKEPVQPEESMVGDLKRLRWETKALPRIEVESGTPVWALPSRYIQFTEARSWSEIAEWAQELFNVDAPPSPEVVQLAAQFQGKPSDEEKTAAALQWVQSEVRYFSLSLGESSHRPAPPATTMRRRWGDCKDKSVLLVQLLHAMKIDAQPVLVSTQGEPGRMMPSPTAFDHVIVRAQMNGRDYFLDATRQPQVGRLEAMGQIWEGASVLVVDKGNRKFTRISTPERQQRVAAELTESIKTAKFGEDATLVSTYVWTGVNAELRRLVIASIPRTALEKSFIEQYEKRYPGVQLKSLDIKDDTQENRVTVVMTMTSPKLFVGGNEGWGVRYAPENMAGMVPLPPSPSRVSPLALPAAGILKYTVDVEFPKEVAVVGDPVSRSIRDAAFDFTSRRVFRGNQASATIELKAFERIVEADRMGTYAANVRKLMTSDPGIFFAAKENIKAAESIFSAGTPTLQRTLETRLNTQAANIAKTIAAGNLSGEDLVSAHCERANALSDLNKLDESLAAAQEAVKVNPTSATALECRGSAYYYKGDFTKAIADFSKALTTAPDKAAYLYYRRGQARHYAGQMAAAIEDFEKSTGVSGKDSEENLYPELWRTWSQQKAGTKPTEAQQKLAAQNPRGDWPRPALAMLHGLITVDQMLATLDGKKGDDRDMNLCEAYFYAGQYYLTHGDKAKAREYFKMTRDKGVIVYAEHAAAGIELAGMGQ